MSTDVTAPASDTPETLDVLTARHRKEQRDLVSRITQKKKQATKKTRKGVNDECERLEQELKERQAEEVRVLNGDAGRENAAEEVESEEESPNEADAVISAQIDKLSINGTATSPTPPAQTPADGAGKKKNRQKERLARRKAEQDAAVRQAEEEARNAPNPRELEKQRFEPLLEEKKLALHEIRADGHCLYAAVADQLSAHSLSLQPRIAVTIADGEKALPYKKVRYAAAGWIEAHADDFEAFMEDPLPEHVRKIRETGEWGGHLELLALAKSYGVRICVLHSDGRVDRIEDEEQNGDKEEIWLGYYKHSHGLGEHYNSLRKVQAGGEGEDQAEGA